MKSVRTKIFKKNLGEVIGSPGFGNTRLGKKRPNLIKEISK